MNLMKYVNYVSFTEIIFRMRTVHHLISLQAEQSTAKQATLELLDLSLTKTECAFATIHPFAYT